MKKLAVILSVLLMSCASASAQWYLVPGLHRTGNKLPSAVQINNGQDDNKQNQDNQTGFNGQDDIQVVRTYDTPFTLDIPDVLNVGLVLPFQISTKTNANFIEMYSGALLAVKDFGAKGKHIEVSVLDETEPTTPVTSDFLFDNHIVIGPVNLEDIESCLEICPDNRFIVSPLEPKAASLTEDCRVIQAPSHWTRQADELVRWLNEDTGWKDEIVLVRDSAGTDSEQAVYLISKLETAGKKFKTVTVSGAQNYQPSAEGTTRFVIASTRDPFINTAVRALGILGSKYSNITLYGTSKVRNSSGVDPEHLYNLGLHYTTSYFIDYEDFRVKEFILAYRALYKNEPGQFAFQGYDIMHYFLNVLSRYGTEWYKKLPEYSERGLQSDFKFDDSESVGNTNVAVRRVLLGKDLSAVIQ